MLLTKKGAFMRLFLCAQLVLLVSIFASFSHKPLVIAAMQTNRILLCLCGLFSLPAMAETACSTAAYDEIAVIKHIHDGDTLHLKDGRKVRLIGINTPEVAHRQKVGERFGAEARAALRAQFKNNKSIALLYGKEHHDRFGRLLAHGFTKHGVNIQAALLAQGYARSIAIPPNTQLTTCYQQQERLARCSHKGLWKKAQTLSADKLNRGNTGFALVKGKLKDININKKGIWLTLGKHLTVGIRPDNLTLFDEAALLKMLNQQIVVRGWLNKNKKVDAANRSFYMRIRHPSAIQLARQFAC